MSRSEYLPPECWREMYRVMQRANVNALRVSLETGMRIDDVLSMRPDDLRGDSFSYVAKKTGKRGRAKLSLDLRRELSAGCGQLWVFPGRDPNRHRTRQTVYKDVKKAAKLLGVEGQISPHSARKTFAVELRKTSGVAEVQKALQHADVETTNLYAFADLAAMSTARSHDADQLAELIAERVVEKIAQMFEISGKS